jgi:DNA helicase IV
MKNQGITHYARAGIGPVLAALDSLRTNPTYEELGHATAAIRAIPTLKVYRWEAWDDTLEAIAATADNGEPAVDNLARRRERLRRTGRRSHARMASRTLLVKGLEYDHVVIANLTKMSDPRNLYVALSRARKTVTVIGGSSRILLRDDQ